MSRLGSSNGSVERFTAVGLSIARAGSYSTSPTTSTVRGFGGDGTATGAGWRLESSREPASQAAADVVTIVWIRSGTIIAVAVARSAPRCLPLAASFPALVARAVGTFGRSA